MNQINYKIVFHIAFLMIGSIAFAQNPIVKNKGLNDPHIHIFNDTAYVYASHDKSIENKKFIMDDWWIWSSPDLVNWTQRSVLKPEDIYIGKPFSSCWATDAAYRNKKYYWYLSEGNQQTGVVVGDTPVGPWKDPLGKPLLTSEMTSTDEYDMTVFEDNGEHYILFGVWEYFIAKLNPDMISLAETPKKIVINNPFGPYGKGKTDDKCFVHKYKGKYYLSWGCFYAMSDNLYGPYDYKDTTIKKESFATGYDAPTWPNGFLQGRHGSFFEWHNQWYFTYCDISQTGNRYFRDTFISYIHYKENGEIATMRVDGIGVGNYKTSQSKIEAEDYFRAEGFVKKEKDNNNFVVETTKETNYLNFPNVDEMDKILKIQFNLSLKKQGSYTIEVRKDNVKGELLVSDKIKLKKQTNPISIVLSLPKTKTKENLYFLVKKHKGDALQIDSFSFIK